MRTLKELREYLKDLNYPNIYTLTDDDVADIFSGANRQNFLKWCIQKTEPNFELSHNPQSAAAAMSDFVHENGFCTSSQKLAFVQGDNGLDALKELEIVGRMLRFLAEIENAKENLDADSNAEQPDVVSVEDVSNFVNTDINLFPFYSAMKTRKPEDRLKKIEVTARQIVEVKEEIELLQSDVQTAAVSHINVDTVDDKIRTLEVAAMALQHHMPLVERSDKTQLETPRFSSRMCEVAANCDSRIQTVIDIMENMRTISSFPKIRGVLNDDEKCDGPLRLVTELAVLSNEILEGKKNTDLL